MSWSDVRFFAVMFLLGAGGGAGYGCLYDLATKMIIGYALASGVGVCVVFFLIFTFVIGLG